MPKIDITYPSNVNFNPYDEKFLLKTFLCRIFFEVKNGFFQINPYFTSLINLLYLFSSTTFKN